MIRLGITGGIGSGKSYVSRLLTRYFGIPVYDSDAEAKRLNNENPFIREQLIRLVGPEVYDEVGLVKPVLAEYLFADSDNAKQVNAIIHPVVREDFTQWCQRQEAGIVGLESAILFESGFHLSMDKVLFVDAPLEVRIRRAVFRDGVQREQIEARIAQQDSSSAMKRADFVIENDGVSDETLLLTLNNIIRYKLK